MNFIVAKTMPDHMIEKLSQFGKVYKGSKLNIKDKSVSYHPDMQIHFLSDFYAVCAPEVYSYYREALPDRIKLDKGQSCPGSTYPENCAYNIARVGNNIICNTKLADGKILGYYKDKDFNIIDVKQGYSKCNICPVGDNLFITEDKGIYKAVKPSDYLSAIYLPHGDVVLDGFDYGFIGGASGNLENKLLLCGKATERLSEILRSNNIEYIELSDSELYDFGSILSFG